MNNILLALSKNRVSHEIQRHLKEDNRSGVILEEGDNISFEQFNAVIIDDLLLEKNLNILEKLNSCNKNFETIIISYAVGRDFITELSRKFRIFRILPSNWTPLSIRYAIYHALLRSKVRKVVQELEATNESKVVELRLLKEQLDQKLQTPAVGIEERREDITDINKKLLSAKKDLEIICEKLRLEAEVKNVGLLFGSLDRELNVPLQRALKMSNTLSSSLGYNDPRLYDFSCMERKAAECLEIISRLKEGSKYGERSSFPARSA